MVLALVLPTAGALQLGRGWNYGNILEKSPPATDLVGEWVRHPLSLQDLFSC